MRMAEREGLRKAHHSNDIHCLTRPNGLIVAKANFRGLSNRDGPPPENETAAPTAIGNGGNAKGKLASYSDNFPITSIGAAATNVVRRLAGAKGGAA